MKGGRHHRTPSELAIVLVSVVGIIIGFILPVFIFFLFILESTTVIWIVNQPERIMLSVTLKPMVSFPIGFIGEFSILRRSLCPLGYLMVTTAALSGTKLFSLGHCSLELLYYLLQHKYWVLHLGV